MSKSPRRVDHEWNKIDNLMNEGVNRALRLRLFFVAIVSFSNRNVNDTSGNAHYHTSGSRCCMKRKCYRQERSIHDQSSGGQSNISTRNHCRMQKIPTRFQQNVHFS